MEVLIWGAGAIGGTLGAYFARAGHSITYVDVVREHVDALNTSGLTIEGPLAEFTVPASALTPEKLQGQFKHVLLCTKAHHTRTATEALAPHLLPDGCVVSVQNGLNEEEIAAVVGPKRVLGAFVNFGADYLSAGRIHYGGRGAVVLGELTGERTPRLDELHALFLTFEPNALASSNILGFLWSKLAYGTMLFGTALTNETIADALAMAEYRSLFIEIAREVLRVAAAENIKAEAFNGFDPQAFKPGASDAQAEATLDELVQFNRRSAKTHSGVWRDLAIRKRRTEVNAQLGPIVRHGSRCGVATPLTHRLMALIHEIEEGSRDLATENLDELLPLMPKEGAKR